MQAVSKVIKKTGKSKKKVYAVAHGKKPGLYFSWDETSKQVTGFPGAKFKGFSGVSEAAQFIKQHAPEVSLDIEIETPKPPKTLIAFVDGAWSAEKGSGCGIYLVHPSGITEEYAVPFERDVPSTNNRAEMKALILGYEKMDGRPGEIFVDSKITWHAYRNSATRRKEFKESDFYLPSTRQQAANVDLLTELHDLIQENLESIKVTWIPREQNMEADRLSKKAQEIDL